MRAYFEGGCSPREVNKRINKLGKLREHLWTKYGMHFHLPERRPWIEALHSGAPREALDALLDSVLSFPPRTAPRHAITIQRNWGWPPELGPLLKLAPERRHRRPPPPPEGEPHTLTILLDLEHVGQHDLATILGVVKAEIRSAMADLPPAFHGAPSRRTPRGLAFLRTMDHQTFQRHLRWYDLAMRGMTFRQIASIEKAARHGRRVEPASAPRRVGPIRGEDAVSKAVARLYEAIHEKPSTEKGLRDASRTAQKPYACPKHPHDCPASCEYLRGFMADFDRKYPAGA